MTRALLPLLAFVSMTSSAATVYSFDYGDWHLRGYRDAVNVGDNACVLSTSWPDGKKIQVNVFPKSNGSRNLTMTILNPRWHVPWRVGETLKVRFDFTSSTYGSAASSGFAQVYTANKIIFRDLSDSFINNIQNFDVMSVFSNTNQALDVSLTGTAAILGDLDSCIAAVLAEPLPGNR